MPNSEQSSAELLQCNQNLIASCKNLIESCSSSGEREKLLAFAKQAANDCNKLFKHIDPVLSRKHEKFAKTCEDRAKGFMDALIELIKKSRQAKEECREAETKVGGNGCGSSPLPPFHQTKIDNSIATVSNSAKELIISTKLFDSRIQVPKSCDRTLSHLEQLIEQSKLVYSPGSQRLEDYNVAADSARKKLLDLKQLCVPWQMSHEKINKEMNLIKQCASRIVSGEETGLLIRAAKTLAKETMGMVREEKRIPETSALGGEIPKLKNNVRLKYEFPLFLLAPFTHRYSTYSK